ncbi:MAG TPA: hypothetical protein VE967_18560 [Gemmatimonadaceae bacterium]|nr:hypothetical protein [Gemmatimonadaceae bacterium]
MLRRLFLAAVVAASTPALSAQAPQTWTVADAPSVTISHASTAPYTVQTARRLSDGRLVVLTAGELHFYGSGGAFQYMSGGRGVSRNAYEFVQDMLVLPGDTILSISINVGPLETREIDWLPTNGQRLAARSVTVDQRDMDAGGWSSSLKFGSLLPNGTLLIEQWPHQREQFPPDQLHRAVNRYAIFDPKTRAVSVLQNVMSFRESDNGIQPLSPAEQSAVGSDRIYIGDNDTTFISAYATDGRPLSTLTVSEAPARVTAADLAAYQRYITKRIAGDTVRLARWTERYNAIPKPERYPLWGPPLVARTGELWIAPAQFSVNREMALMAAEAGHRNVWHVFSQAGARLASIVLPDGFTPLDIGADYVLGVSYDDMRNERVEMYALTRR